MHVPRVERNRRARDQISAHPTQIIWPLVGIADLQPLRAVGELAHDPGPLGQTLRRQGLTDHDRITARTHLGDRQHHTRQRTLRPGRPGADAAGERDLLAAEPVNVTHLLAPARREPRPPTAVVRLNSPTGQTPAGDKNLTIGGLHQRMRNRHRPRARVGITGVPAPGAVDAVHRRDETLGELPFAIDELVLPHLILRQRLSEQSQKLRFALRRVILDRFHLFPEFLEVSGDERAGTQGPPRHISPDAAQFRRRRLQENRRRPPRLGRSGRNANRGRNARPLGEGGVVEVEALAGATAVADPEYFGED